MAHHLLVQAIIRLRDKGYKKYLKENEYPRGSLVDVNVIISNNGTVDFPGGTLVKLTAETGNSTVITWRTLNQQIPTLKPKQKWNSGHQWFQMDTEGICWFKCEIQANDKQPISFYQHELGDGLQNWVKPVTIVNRESIETLKLLGEINSKIESLLKKT